MRNHAFWASGPFQGSTCSRQRDSCFVGTEHKGGNENWNFLVNLNLAIKKKRYQECGRCSLALWREGHSPAEGKVLGRLTPLPCRSCWVGCSHWVLPTPSLSRHPQFPKGGAGRTPQKGAPNPRQVRCHEPGASASCWTPSEPQLPHLENGLATALPCRLSMGPSAASLRLGLPTEDSG